AQAKSGPDIRDMLAGGRRERKKYVEDLLRAPPQQDGARLSRAARGQLGAGHSVDRVEAEGDQSSFERVLEPYGAATTSTVAGPVELSGPARPLRRCHDLALRGCGGAISTKSPTSMLGHPRPRANW